MVSIAAGVFAIALPLLPWISPLSQYALPLPFVASVSVGLAVPAIFGWRVAQSTSIRGRLLGVITVTASLGLIYMGPVLGWFDLASNDTEQQVEVLKRQLPPETKLVSIGLVEHVFPFHFGDPIHVLSRSELDSKWPGGIEYFCFSKFNLTNQELPFQWVQIAEITCDRTRIDPPQNVVVIGKRTSE